tara:strand:- start:504 stop:1433 length:930 start_codon:yes stop_codon:yes gene_type:complete
MNWITKFIKPKIKSLFKKRSSETKEALWTTCECKNLVYKDDLFKNLSVCPTCGFHHKINCLDRFSITFDSKEYEIIKTPLPIEDPLKFVDTKKYTDRLKQARKKTNQSDAILIAEGKLNNIQVTIGAQNMSFIGGSVGAASGEAFIHGVQNAIDKKTPFIFFTASGGQRMMESAIALAQMSRTVLAVNELKKNNLPYIIIMTNATYGGVTASFASLGDVLIGEKGAHIGFSGPRVIESTVKEQLPSGFQTAEFIKDHGGLDLVVERKYLRSTISTLLSILLKKKEVQAISDPENVTNLKETLPKTSKAV